MPYRTLAQVGSDGTVKAGPTWNLANATSSVAGIANDKSWFYQMRRNGNATPIRMQHACGAAPSFHHFLDPAAAPSQLTLIFEDMVQAEIAAGTCEVQFGFVEHIVSTTIGDLVGVGFRAGSGTTNDWHCFVKDCPLGTTGNTVSLHDFDTGILMTDPHVLAIVIDGPTQTISWYIDRVLVSSFTPSAVPDRMSAAANNVGPLCGVFAVVPALGDCTVRSHAGGWPQLRIAPYPIGGEPAPSGGSRMYVSIGG